MSQHVNDPFAMGDSAPSVSFKDAPFGTSYTLEVTAAPELVQSTDFETGDKAFWPDGKPKMSVVTAVIDKASGEARSLWAAKPSALFAAIADAQKASGALIAPGGTLTVTYTHDKPNEKNPRLSAAKQYSVMYQPPNAFTMPEAAPAPAPTPAIPAAPAGPAPAAIAALQAAGIDPKTVYPDWQG